MTFQFESFADFFSMAGHGPYVWACYLVTALGIAYLLFSPLMAKKQLLKQQKQTLKREEASKKAAAPSSASEQPATPAS
ncbi:heme exporter protein CcmD [Marinibactrum halimedae]|uniref:Heme exporter protein D n=1 Tax=Marinibactrum halimedae TaxID=1444977 RepID=A0AA37TCT6_9GAMM|nr:heme exporter protein CcmD [Marinibactrum halimedae]MCD9460396.1 heme exporter protein CcmD [Marinibactrum halimedae]GLS27475.1 hypothetical protein GCM10007877_31940 [Marinibactrum halimedae]